MSGSRLSSLRRRRLTAGLVCLVGLLGLAGCKEAEEETAAGYEPSKLVAIKGKSDDHKRIVFTPEGAARTGLQTEPTRKSRGRSVVPYEALIYDGEAKTFVYISPKPLSYVRETVDVDRIEGERVFLSDGPSAGTDVVTVGATEVYGTELEIAGSH